LQQDKVDIYSYCKERLKSTYKLQWTSAILMFVAFFTAYISSVVRHSDKLGLILMFHSMFLIRILVLWNFNKFYEGKEKKWFYQMEWFFGITGFLYGISFTSIIMLVAQMFPQYYLIFVLIFFNLMLGNFRSAIPSFKYFIFIMLGVCVSLIFVIDKEFPIDIIVFYLVGLGAFVIYLIKSQYQLTSDFVLKLRLLDEQKKYIGDLKKQIKLEEELQTQKEMNIQNARLTALGEMAAGIAHEINNPLTIIALHIKTLSKKFGSEVPSKEVWDTTSTKILDTVDRASKIVSSLRSFSRDGALSKLEIITFRSILDGTLVFIEKRFEHHNIPLEIKFECSEELKVEVNEISCSQVVVNLLNNAFYELEKNLELPKKWCKIIVRENSEFLEVRIIDSGLGVPSDIQEKLFTPFFTSKPPGEGTGLGLSLSKSMMRDMGGDLVFEKEASNTTFLLSLKLK